MPIPFIGPSYVLNTRKSDVQRTVNMYLAVNEVPGGKSVARLESIPGLTAFSVEPAPPPMLDWLIFNAGDGSEPISMSMGNYNLIGSPVAFADGYSLSSNNGSGSNDTLQRGDTLYLPLSTENPIPGVGEYTWAPASGSPIAPEIVGTHPSGSESNWATANMFVHFPGTSPPSFSGWAGGILTLYTNNDNTSTRKTVITFSASAAFYPPVSVEYVDD